jgi:hypothetical protein
MAEEEPSRSDAAEERRNQRIRDRIDLIEEEKAEFEELNKTLLESEVTIDKLSASYEAANEAKRLEIRLLKLQISLDKDLETSNKKKIDDLKVSIEDNNTKQKQLAEEIRLTDGLTSSVATFFGVNNDFNDSLLGSIDALAGSAQAQELLAIKLRKTMTLQNVAYSLVKKFTQATLILMKAQDAALVSFNKQTGATALYGDELSALEADMYQHGVTMDDAAASYGALVKNVYGLKNMSSAAREELSTTTALLNEFGVEADTTAANVQFMTASIGMSVGAATKYQRELFSLAQQIGMPPAEMAEGFKAAAPKLAAFGKDMGNVFKKLAVNARAAGMEVEQMLGIVEQFDTFEGAAQSVGKLNALLGGPFLNSMEMVTTTDPTERMRMLSNALNSAGKSFDELSYYERKSIASAAGLSDVNELALVMAGNFDKAAGGAHKSQAEIEKLAEQTAEFQTIQDELMQTMRMFAVQLRPVINGIKTILQGIQDLNKALGFEKGSGLIGSILAVVAGWMILKRVVKLAGVTMKFFNVAGAVTNKIMKGQKTLIVENGKAAGKSAPQLLALGAAALLMGAGVAIAAWGVSQFVKAFAPMDADRILAVSVAIAVFGGVMYALISALMGLTSGPQAAFFAIAVAGFFAISASIAIAALSVGFFVSSMATLFKVMNPGTMMAFASSMGIFLGVLLTAGAAGPGIALATLAITGLAASFYLLDTKKVESLTALFQVLANITAEAGDNIMDMGKGMGLVAASMTAMALNPLAYATLPALLVGTAASTTVGAATTTTYSSDSPDGLSKKSGTASAKEKIDVTVKIEVDSIFDRFFKAKVVNTTRKVLNSNQGASSSG